MRIADSLRDILWRFKRSRRAHVAVVVIGVLIVVALLGYVAFQQKDSGEVVVKNGDENPARVIEGRRVLDGVVAEAQDVNPAPIAVMIDNLAVASARPHAGLSQASVVYEALVEGGITRQMAVFGVRDRIPEIASVRSARPYFVQLAREYNGMFVHAGGSPQAMEDLRNSDDVWIVDGTTGEGAPYFKRDPNRSAPHNLVTDTDLLAFVERDLKVPETGAFEGWQFAEEEGVPFEEERTLSIDFSTVSYSVDWLYRKDENLFVRKNGGVEDTDRNTQKPLTAKNILVQFVPTSFVDEQRLKMNLVGEGGGLFLKNGEMENVTWKKESDDARTRFFDSDEKEIVLNPGPTWVELLPTDGRVTFE